MSTLPVTETSTLERELILLSGGVVHSLAPDNPTADSLLLTGNRIAAVGTRMDCLAAAEALSSRSGFREIDLNGGVVLPGFVDAHAHPLMYGQLLSWVDCSPTATTDIPGMIGLLRQAAENIPGTGPIRGFGYEHRNLAERRHPTRQELDQVSIDREVYVMNASGHGGVVNTFTLEKYGIDDDTPDPQGGTFFRDSEGQLTGELSDAACNILTGPEGVKVGHHGPNFHLNDPAEQHRNQLLAAQHEFLRNGVTSIGDAQVSKRELTAYLDLLRDGLLTARINAYFLSHLLDEVLELGLVDKFGNARLSLSGIKLYADGTLGGWTAYFPEGYANDPCRTGSLYHPPEEYRALILKAHAAGLQTATHAQSPTAIQMVLDAIAAAVEASPRPDHRHRIEHCGLPTGEQIARMAELGVMPVNQTQHYYNWGPGVVDAIGTPGERFNPLGEFVSSGVPVTISSDAPVAPPQPLEAVQAAVTRVTRSGVRLGPESLTITRLEALRAHTINGAIAVGREHELGTLEPGKLADFVILDNDPLAVDEASISSIQVSETWIDGLQVFVAGAK